MDPEIEEEELEDQDLVQLLHFLLLLVKQLAVVEAEEGKNHHEECGEAEMVKNIITFTLLQVQWVHISLLL
jgi:hypothetical protein